MKTYIGNTKYKILDVNGQRMMAANSKPYDAEIEYLESDGNAYINTGIYLGNTFYATRRDIDISFMLIKNIRAISSILGSYSTTTGTPRMHFSVDSSQKFTTQNVTITSGVNIGDSISLDTVYNVKLYNTGNYNQALLSLTLFAMNGNTAGVTRKINGMRLYSCSISTNGELLRDYIPVRVSQVGYMYDKVSHQLFGNSGIGDFILGPDK